MTDEISNENAVPRALKWWFVVHFAADILLAIPLFIDPVFTLKTLGLHTVDPYTARIAAAALFGIGIESLLGRNADLLTYKNMLNLKIIWSAGAIMGLLITFIFGYAGRPISVAVLALIFVMFHILWLYWRIRVSRVIKVRAAR